MGWIVTTVNQLNESQKFRFPNKDEIWHLTPDKKEFIFMGWYRKCTNGKVTKRVRTTRKVWVKSETINSK